MKKKRLANIVMVLLIAVIAVTGLLTAFHLRGGEDGDIRAQPLQTPPSDMARQGALREEPL